MCKEVGVITEEVVQGTELPLQLIACVRRRRRRRGVWPFYTEVIPDIIMLQFFIVGRDISRTAAERAARRRLIVFQALEYGRVLRGMRRHGGAGKRKEERKRGRGECGAMKMTRRRRRRRRQRVCDQSVDS